MFTEWVDWEFDDGTSYGGPRFAYLGPRLMREFFDEAALDELVAFYDVFAVPEGGASDDPDTCLWKAQAQCAPAVYAVHRDKDEAKRQVAWSCAFTGQRWPSTEALPKHVIQAQEHHVQVTCKDGVYWAKLGMRSVSGPTRWAALYRMGELIEELGSEQFVAKNQKRSE